MALDFSLANRCYIPGIPSRNAAKIALFLPGVVLCAYMFCLPRQLQFMDSVGRTGRRNHPNLGEILVGSEIHIIYVIYVLYIYVYIYLYIIHNS